MKPIEELKSHKYTIDVFIRWDQRHGGFYNLFIPVLGYRSKSIYYDTKDEETDPTIVIQKTVVENVSGIKEKYLKLIKVMGLHYGFNDMDKDMYLDIRVSSY